MKRPLRFAALLLCLTTVSGCAGTAAARPAFAGAGTASAESTVGSRGGDSAASGQQDGTTDAGIGGASDGDTGGPISAGGSTPDTGGAGGTGTSIGGGSTGDPMSADADLVLPAEQLVLQVTYGAGFTPEIYRASVAPVLSVYGDGRIIAQVDSAWGYPARLVVGAADPAAVAGLVATMVASGALADSESFGSPGVTDLGFTTVLVHGWGEPATVSVYGLGFGFDDDPALTAEQSALRHQLLTWIDEAAALRVGERDFQPAALQVDDLGVIDYEVEYAPEWPAAAVGNGCSVVTEDAAVIYAAALENPGSVWRMPDGLHEVAVVPLVPGQPGCS